MNFEVDFGYGERHTHSVFLPEDVTDSSNSPGLYAWYLRLPPQAMDEGGFEPYRHVHVKRRFSITASASLGEQMDGTMERLPTRLKTAKPGEDLDMPFFASAFSAFSPPIYIGRSRGIRTRLMAHLRALDGEMARGSASQRIIAEPASDSDDESSQFGVRVAQMLVEQGLDHYTGLFVKIVYAPTNDATKRAELLMNRTIHPVLGRL